MRGGEDDSNYRTRTEDPLLVLDHQGGSGNPTFLIQQDETAVAYV
jgi:hypothetical protein